MRKFTIISRKGATFLQEVEVAYVTPVEDPSVMWLGEGEIKFKILKPDSLFEKQNDGSLKSPVWCWFAFHANEISAREAAELELKKELERVARKSHTEFNEEEYLKRCKEIQVSYL